MQTGHVWHDCMIYRGGMARPEGFKLPASGLQFVRSMSTVLSLVSPTSRSRPQNLPQLSLTGISHQQGGLKWRGLVVSKAGCKKGVVASFWQPVYVGNLALGLSGTFASLRMTRVFARQQSWGRAPCEKCRLTSWTASGPVSMAPADWAFGRAGTTDLLALGLFSREIVAHVCVPEAGSRSTPVVSVR